MIATARLRRGAAGVTGEHRPARPVPQVPGRGTAGETGSVHARSALFDLYGDHLRTRASRAPVASLVRLLAPLGITAPAVRTAVSRMVRQGWLSPVRLGSGAGYALTPRASRRLDEAAERIYRHGDPQWDGQWHVVVVERVRERTRRERIRAGLHYLGYAALNETAWIGPRASVELDALLETERLRAERFRATYDGDPTGLPAPLLPAHWPGHEAARLFHAESARLLPAASRFVDCCLQADTQDSP
jgi:phenylacetic acid degradation operon negative regulatory protein